MKNNPPTIRLDGLLRFLIFFTSFSFLILILNACQNEDSTRSVNKSQYLKDYTAPEHLWGLLNLDNEIVYKPTFDELRPFQEGYAAININGKWGFLDTSLNITVKPTYRAAWNFNNGIARVEMMDGTYNFISTDNTLLFDKNFLYAHDYIDAYASANVGLDSFVILTENGNISEIIKAEDLTPTRNGYFIAHNFDLEELYNKNGKRVRNIRYDRIGFLTDTLLKVKKGDYVGVIDMHDKVLIPFKYRRISAYDDAWIIGISDDGIDVFKGPDLKYSFAEYLDFRYAGYDRFVYMTMGKWGIMDTAFQVVSAPIYNQLDNFNQGLAPYNRGELWGYVNIEGIEVTEPIYGLAIPYQNDYARVLYYEGMALIDKYQRIIIPPAERTYRDVSASYVPFKGR